jgi:uncharacterized protein (TIGR00251 family)
VRLTPRSSADRVEGVVDGALRVRVHAPPVDGSANAALIRLLAAEIGVPSSAIRIVAGGTSRRKVVEIDGLASAALRSRWPDLAV